MADGKCSSFPILTHCGNNIYIDDGISRSSLTYGVYCTLLNGRSDHLYFNSENCESQRGLVYFCMLSCTHFADYRALNRKGPAFSISFEYMYMHEAVLEAVTYL